MSVKFKISQAFVNRSLTCEFLGKRLLVNDSVIMLSSEMHPRSGTQSIYDGNGDLVVKMEEDYVPPRRYWLVNSTKTHFLAETFDYQRKLTQWQWGYLKVNFEFSRAIS